MIIKVEIEGKVYNVTIKDVHSNPVLAEVDGKVYQVFPEAQGPAVIPAVTTQPTPVPTAAPSAPAPAAGGGLTLNAPLPGVIVSIDVQAGEAVKSGQQICTLEAMKMKNAIRSDRDGVIAQVNVNPGDLVKHNQPLFTFQA
jgi:biotin carboxyl carrier protein